STLWCRMGFQGQKVDSVLLIGSASGRVGPVRGLVQGNLITGTARGGVLEDLTSKGLNGTVAPKQHYDILAGSVIAYAEVDLGMVQPFGMFLLASGDGDPTCHKLQCSDHLALGKALEGVRPPLF